MKFHFKIILTTLAILIVALVLNSVLSLASFEKLYVASLVSTYEIAGKNLKRKIEKSLRFGKPLTEFKGMERLLAEVRETNPNISEVSIATLDRQVRYHTDKQMIGTQMQIGTPEFDDDHQAISRLVDDSYITLVPLYDRSKKIVGVIHLSFPRKVVYNQLKKMALENGNILWILMLVTSMIIILLMGLFIVSPVKNRMREIGQRLKLPIKLETMGEPSEIATLKHEDSDSGNDKYEKQDGYHYHFKVPPSKIMLLDISQIRNEINRLQWHIYKFLDDAFQTLDSLPRANRRQQEIIDICTKLEKSADTVRQLIHQSDTLSAEHRKHLETLTPPKGACLNLIRPMAQGGQK